MRRERWEWLVVGLVAGAAAGALAGLLLAPATGRESRRRLAEVRRRIAADTGEALERLVELADEAADWGWRAVGAESSRTRARIAELRADVERLSSAR